MVVTPGGERLDSAKPDWTTVWAASDEAGDRVVRVVVWEERSRKEREMVSLPRGSRERVSDVRIPCGAAGVRALPSPVRRVRVRPTRVRVGEPFCRVCQEEDSRHQSPSSETYRVSFETMRSVSLQSIWMLRFMSESAIITNKISSYCFLSLCFGPFCRMCRENA